MPRRRRAPRRPPTIPPIIPALLELFSFVVEALDVPAPADETAAVVLDAEPELDDPEIDVGEVAVVVPTRHPVSVPCVTCTPLVTPTADSFPLATRNAERSYVPDGRAIGAQP